ncbi:sigma 54-interacting transcriptional regulator [Photobacterium sanguinicancri]|uniref:sigma 54-interacting transcriptional regulator n=1 Tax=Photobacterium sanguinicancri TaxID=875932 RepID=UPI0026E3C179|nr:sigma 54-interacting transcriptional regulator [Photobacterium sanguinicancri]MDO6496492.1 sigma 54-interacting transcriptional regulator [Photobacterium sanguinicancri]
MTIIVPKSETETLSLKDKQSLSMIEDMSEFVTRQTPDMKFTYVNDAYCEFIGKTHAELIGKNEKLFIYPEDKQKLFNFIASITLQSPVKEGTFRFVDKAGNIAWLEWTGRAFFDHDGKVIEYQAVGRNITEKKQARDKLEKEVEIRTLEIQKAHDNLAQLNSHLNKILINMSEGVFVIDELGNVDFLNNILINSLHISQCRLEKLLYKQIFGNDENPIKSLMVQGLEFKNTHASLPSTHGDIPCLISGTLIDKNLKGKRKGIIIVKPHREVSKLVNDFTGNQAQFTFKDIITIDPVMMQRIYYAKKLAANSSNVLIEGESGTGKELFAQSIHNTSKRKDGPFIAVNCGAIPRELIGSELFGYTDGAFTGAKKGGKPGKFELASGGTLFLDEIGDMPFEQQVALLRVIQEKRLTRIGGVQSIPIDVRIICATHKNLLSEMNKGNFRQDLYYRLNVMSFEIPPLRKRPDDILHLFEHFMAKLTGKTIPTTINYEPLLLDCLKRYSWMGNVRELQNITERLYYISNGEKLTLSYLPENILGPFKEQTTAPQATANITSMVTLGDVRKSQQENTHNHDKETMLSLLHQNKGNVRQAAMAMCISRSTFYRKMKLYNIIE